MNRFTSKVSTDLILQTFFPSQWNLKFLSLLMNSDHLKISKEIYITLKFYQVLRNHIFLSLAPNYHKILTSISHIQDFVLYFSDPLIISPHQHVSAEPGRYHSQ